MLKCGCICLVIKRFLYFSSLPGSCVCRLGPPLQESLHLNYFRAWVSSSSEKLGWSVWTETNGFEACKLNSALFLLGLHNFNDQEVKHPFKQNQNLVLDFQIQFWRDFSSCQRSQLCIWNGLKFKKHFKGSYVGRADEGEIPFSLHFHMACLCQNSCLFSVPSWQPDLAGLNEALLNKGTLCFELCALSLHQQPGQAFMLNKVNKYRQAVFCKLKQNKTKQKSAFL